MRLDSDDPSLFLPNGMVSRDFLERLSEYLGLNLTFFSKGTTSLTFMAGLEGETVLLKLQRPDSPRANLMKEFHVTKFLSTFKLVPRPLAHGRFMGMEYLLREFAEGEELRRGLCKLNEGHIFEMVNKAWLLDRLGVDHGQIQGGKHVIVGDVVWFIDFEKASFRKPKNLSSLISMLFLGRNVISQSIYKKFGLDEAFRRDVLKAAKEYKSERKPEVVMRVLEEYLG